MSASVKLECVPAHLKRAIWPLVADRIRASALRTDLSHTADIERDLFEGAGVLWIARDGNKIEAAAVTLLVHTDQHLVCMITALGGENMRHWIPLLDQLENWARAEGAALVRIFGRPGWVRMLQNYRVKNVVLERLL